jgi:hypothetical protein
MTIGKAFAGILFWAVVLMLFAMLFSVAWNMVAPKRFGLSHLDSLDSLCLLSCVWLAGRMAGFSKAINVSVQEAE